MPTTLLESNRSVKLVVALVVENMVLSLDVYS